MPTWPIDRIEVGNRFRKDLGNIDSLVDSIREVGLIHPIVVDERTGRLIAGERRLNACKRLGMRTVPVRTVKLDDDHALRAQHDENVERQPFTKTEMVAILRAVRDQVKTPAHIHADHPDRQSLPVSSGKTVDKVAPIVGTSPETLRKAEAVVVAAEADPTLAPVVEEMDRTGKVDPAYKKVARTKPKKRLLKRPAPMSTGEAFAGRMQMLRVSVDSLCSVRWSGYRATPAQLRELNASISALVVLRDAFETTEHPAPEAQES